MRMAHLSELASDCGRRNPATHVGQVVPTCRHGRHDSGRCDSKSGRSPRPWSRRSEERRAGTTHPTNAVGIRSLPHDLACVAQVAPPCHHDRDEREHGDPKCGGSKTHPPGLRGNRAVARHRILAPPPRPRRAGRPAQPLRSPPEGSRRSEERRVEDRPSARQPGNAADSRAPFPRRPPRGQKKRRAEARRRTTPR